MNLRYMHEINRHHVIKYIEVKEKKGITKGTILQYINLLKQVINFAIDNELLSKSPIKKWPKLITEKNDDLPRFLNIDELEVLEELAYKKNTLFADVIVVLVRTRLRVGELATLEPRHIDILRIMAIVGHRDYSTMRCYLALSPKYVLQPPKLPFE